ncbi:hypothetical protein [Acinetobacter sp. Marseille-Q1618]|uniref:hypothetical protein n=1 Tax=Acinetobacter sp. Marseille-Q1618 TaxID=2697502 RepID=UPI0020C41F3D|nr:hypothetical protein [Acinetobacter sp. Marseille-Q1618]
MKNPNIPKHPCSGKCSEFKEEQCNHCLIPANSMELESTESDFLVGDVVVLTAAGTKDVLLEIIQHKYTNDLYRVRILKTGACGPIHKDQIRNASVAELHANRRLNEAELALAEVS